MTSPTPADHLVVLLHGLGRTRHSLLFMDRALRNEGFRTLRIGYPSMRQPIEQHAAAVARRLESIPTPGKGNPPRFFGTESATESLPLDFDLYYPLLAGTRGIAVLAGSHAERRTKGEGPRSNATILPSRDRRYSLTE